MVETDCEIVRIAHDADVVGDGHLEVLAGCRPGVDDGPDDWRHAPCQLPGQQVRRGGPAAQHPPRPAQLHRRLQRAGGGRPARERHQQQGERVRRAQERYLDALLHRTGHSFGVTGHEAPFLAVSCDREIQPGMLFSIEPGIYLPGAGGFRRSDTVLVTDNGNISLTTAPDQLEDVVLAQ